MAFIGDDYDESIEEGPSLYHWADGRKKMEIHMSHITSYMRCPQQFYHKYIKRDLPKKDYSPDLAYGNVQHKILKDQLRKKAEKQPLWTPEERRDRISDLIENEAEELPLSVRGTFDRQKDGIMSMADLLLDNYVPTIEPLFIEQAFNISFPNTSYILAGSIDMLREPKKQWFIDLNGNKLIESTIPNQKFAVDDLKTSKASPARNDYGGYVAKPEHVLQQTAYSLGAWVVMGGQPINFERTLNRTMYAVKTKTPTLKPANYIVGKNEVNFLANVFLDMVKALQTGLFPRNPTGWWCDNDRCPAFSVCKKANPISLEEIFFKEKKKDEQSV